MTVRRRNPREKVGRNEALVAAVLAGEAQTDLAVRFGISPARVHQVFNRWRRRLWEGAPVFVPLAAFDNAEIWTPERQHAANAAPGGFGLFSRSAEDA